VPAGSFLRGIPMKQDHRRLLLHAGSVAAGLAAALLAVALLRGAASRSTPPPPDGYVAARAAGYTLYAPSPRALREGVEEIEHARSAFREHFGVEPGRIVVVLADSPSALRALDLTALQDPRARLLPFVTREHLAEAPDGTDSLAARFRAEAKTLSHEVCHLLAATHADRRVRRGRGGGDGYGHADLPDWVDEMAAILCESPASRAVRRTYLRSALDERIPLAELTTMEHPVSVAIQTRRAGSDPVIEAGANVQVLRGEEAREFLRNLNAPLFYAQSLSLGEFLFEHGGAATLRTITEQLAAGRTLDEALVRAARAAPALPRSVPELEEAWVRWVRAGEE
jgi:hypothetical protein